MLSKKRDRRGQYQADTKTYESANEQSPALRARVEMWIVVHKVEQVKRERISRGRRINNGKGCDLSKQKIETIQEKT